MAILPVALILFSARQLSEAVRSEEQHSVTLASLAANVTARELLEGRLKSDSAALRQLADRMETGVEWDRTAWEHDALKYAQDGPEYQAIEWIDPTLHVKWAVPQRGNEATLHMSVSMGNQRRSAIARAWQGAQIVVSNSVPLVQGGRGFVIYAPVFRNHRFEGMIAGVINVERLVRTLPAEWMGSHYVRLSEGGSVLFSNAPASAPENGTVSSSDIFPTHPRWQLDTALTPAAFGLFGSTMPTTILLLRVVLGVFVGLFALLLEKTSHKLAIAREGTEFLAGLSEASQSLTYVIDCEFSTIKYYNRFLLDFLGTNLEEMPQSSLVFWESRIHPDDGAIRKQQLAGRSALANGQTVEASYRVKDGNGNWRWVALRECVLSRQKNGDVKLVLGSGQDVTEIRVAEEQARQGRAAVEEIVDLAPIGMALVGLDGKWLRVNSALCELVGYSPAELLSLDSQAITHPDDRLTDLSQVEMMLEGEIHTYSMEKRFVTKAGKVLWAMLTVGAVRDADGKPTQFITQIQDITQRKEMEVLLNEHQRLIERQSSRLYEEVERLETGIRTDSLTGVNNRRWFDERMVASSAIFHEYGHEVSLIMLDVDHFKSFNDAYGHFEGDRVLKAVGEVLLNLMRGRDTVARYGGEEFAIICPDTSLAAAIEAAERLRLGIARINSLPRPVTASFGVSSFSAACPSVEAVIKAADRGLYLAKELGRDRVCVAPDVELVSPSDELDPPGEQSQASEELKSARAA